MKLIVLTEQFYSDYINCAEILKKKDRPYVCAIITDGYLTYAVPLRHHIQHKYAFRTVGDAGLDYTRTVILSGKHYISRDTPIIDSTEFDIIKQNEGAIRRGLLKYIKLYKKAKQYRHNLRYSSILKYSSLQYFEEYL